MRSELTHPILLATALQLLLPSLSADRLWARLLAIGVLEVYALRYAAWRLAYTLPEPELSWQAGWQWSFLAAEAAALIYVCFSAALLTRRSNLTALADERERQLRARVAPPTVSVLIPTVNEPLEVLEATIQAALRIDYPDVEICILDDDKGRRSTGAASTADDAPRVHHWLPALCARYQVRYLRRSNSDGAKAGNLNHGLAQSAGEVLLVLDADFRATPNILWRTVGLLDDSTGIVQTPQHYYSTDPIQHNLGGGRCWTEEQRYFFDVVLPAKEAWGCAVCVGTAFVVRRDVIGPNGFEDACLSEDVYGGYAILGRGYRVRYLNEPLAFGAAADSLAEYIRQRVRWCQGIIQAMWLPYGPFRAPRLRLIDRLLYAEMPAYWISQYGFLLLLLLAPAVYFWTGVPAFACSADDAANYLAPRAISAAMVSYWLSDGRVMPMISEIRSVVALECIVRAICGLATNPNGKPFVPTLKGEDRSTTAVQWRIMAPLFALSTITAAGIWTALATDWSPVHWDEYLATNVALGCYIVVLLWLSCLACIDRPKDTRTADYHQTLRGRWLRALAILVQGGERTPAWSRPHHRNSTPRFLENDAVFSRKRRIGLRDENSDGPDQPDIDGRFRAPSE